MTTTDRQAALAAAVQIVSSMRFSPAAADLTERYTITMADAFLTWLQGGVRITMERWSRTDERLTPNEDFRSPGHARTERIDPSAVLAAAAEPTMRVTVLHEIDPVNRTPGGSVACTCGQKWPCTLRPTPEF